MFTDWDPSEPEADQFELELELGNGSQDDIVSMRVFKSLREAQYHRLFSAIHRNSDNVCLAWNRGFMPSEQSE